MMTNERLAEIEARANAATPAPWVHDGYYGVSGKNFNIYDEGGHRREDAAFIAAARQDVPDLIAEVRRLRAMIKAADEIDGR